MRIIILPDISAKTEHEIKLLKVQLRKAGKTSPAGKRIKKKIKTLLAMLDDV